MPSDDVVDTVAGERLLAWHETEVWGRVASYGVGGGDGPAVLFLHGWGLSGRAYRSALKRLLARGFRVWAPALPGFDGSAALPRGREDLEQYAAWVDAFCTAVGITEPLVLMGHSFGGGVAIQTAHDFPARTRPGVDQLDRRFGLAPRWVRHHVDGRAAALGLGPALPA